MALAVDEEEGPEEESQPFVYEGSLTTGQACDIPPNQPILVAHMPIGSYTLSQNIVEIPAWVWGRHYTITVDTDTTVSPGAHCVAFMNWFREPILDANDDPLPDGGEEGTIPEDTTYLYIRGEGAVLENYVLSIW